MLELTILINYVNVTVIVNEFEYEIHISHIKHKQKIKSMLRRDQAKAALNLSTLVNANFPQIHGVGIT